jgi:hypothetical protein
MLFIIEMTISPVASVAGRLNKMRANNENWIERDYPASHTPGISLAAVFKNRNSGLVSSSGPQNMRYASVILQRHACALH